MADERDVQAARDWLREVQQDIEHLSWESVVLSLAAEYARVRDETLEQAAKYHDSEAAKAQHEADKYTADDLADDYSSGHTWLQEANDHRYHAAAIRALTQPAPQQEEEK